MKDLDFEEIQEMYEAAKNYNSVRRQEAQDESFFYWISHYTDEWRATLPLRFQGQFDQLRKAGRKIISDLVANPIQADFQPIDGTEQELGEFLNKMYRTDARRNASREAFHNAINECVPCGVGGWRLATDYETDRVGDTKQIVRRIPIYEYNATVFFDPSAKRLDKSDAKFVEVITGYKESDYKKLKEDLDSDEEYCNSPDGFMPVTSNAGMWQGEADQVFVIEHYQRYKKKVKIKYYKDLFGEVTAFYDEQVKGQENELANAGFRLVDTKTIQRWCVKKYTCSGEGILDAQDIAGTELPIVPFYGERAFVDGVEHYEGITRLAQDPQRLRDFQLSYLADIVSTSPRPKPIFLQEQIQDFEYMYEENGADNNYAYYLQNRKSKVGGEDLPLGPVGIMPEQPIPSALIASIQLMSEATNDVAQSGAPNSIADVNLSGNAVSQIRAMLDENSIIYQEHFKYAIRRDAEIYVGMVPDVYDMPRKVVLTSQDGSREDAMVMQSMIDLETGEHKILNDLRTAKFDVFAEIGTNYESQKQQQRQELIQLIQTLDTTDPLRPALVLKYVALGDGVDNEDMKSYAKKQLILSGFKDPETDEEKSILAESQQQAQQPDANMVLAQAEMEKAKQDGVKNEIDAFKAQTDRFAVQVKAQEAGANIDFKEVQKLGQQIDNMHKLRNPPKSNHVPDVMRA